MKIKELTSDFVGTEKSNFSYWVEFKFYRDFKLTTLENICI
jgi:hypothetical protein